MSLWYIYTSIFMTNDHCGCISAACFGSEPVSELAEMLNRVWFLPGESEKPTQTENKPAETRLHSLRSVINVPFNHIMSPTTKYNPHSSSGSYLTPSHGGVRVAGWTRRRGAPITFSYFLLTHLFRVPVWDRACGDDTSVGSALRAAQRYFSFCQVSFFFFFLRVSTARAR